MKKKVIALTAMIFIVVFLVFIIKTNLTDEMISTLKIAPSTQLININPKLFWKEDQPQAIYFNQASKENDTQKMTLIEIDNEIDKINQKIIGGNFIENSNRGVLTNYQHNYFKKLLRKRDELFVLKVDLLLSN